MINITLPLHLEVLMALNRYGVRYLLVGGYAVIHYGYHRTTGDMDLWVQPSNEQKPALVAAMADLGYDQHSLDQLSQLDFTEAVVFNVGTPPDKIDFMTKVNLVTFEAAYEQRRVVALGDDLQVPIIHYHHLVLTKINTGRKKDEADIEELQKITKHRRDKP